MTLVQLLLVSTSCLCKTDSRCTLPTLLHWRCCSAPSLALVASPWRFAGFKSRTGLPVGAICSLRLIQAVLLAGATGVDTHLEPVPGIHTAHPDTDMKVAGDKTSGASPSDEAMASIEPHKPSHEIAASVDAAAHGQSRFFT